MSATKKTTICIALAGFVTLALYHQVDRSLSPDDLYYADAYIGSSHIKPDRKDAEAELAFLRSIQELVLAVTPDGAGIPNDQLREPRQVMNAETAMCFDRARLLEKIFIRAGFEVRHASLYLKKPNLNIPVLLKPGIASHAILEVRTQKGWVVLDTNTVWLAVSKEGAVHDMGSINRAIEQNQPIAWREPAPMPFFSQPTTFVYGLYSRHGRFYPPYNRIPDVNYGELLHNIW